MTPSEIESILAIAITPNPTGYLPPGDSEWRSLEQKFNCSFSSDFRNFISLTTTRYSRPGEILEASAENGNDSISLCYDMEQQFGHWRPEMIPFFSIGNGDYYCLCSTECPESRVFYFYLDSREYDVEFDSFAAWLAAMPELYH